MGLGVVSRISLKPGRIPVETISFEYKGKGKGAPLNAILEGFNGEIEGLKKIIKVQKIGQCNI